MRLVEDSLPIPSGVGTNKESRKQLPAIRRSTTLRSACKGITTVAIGAVSAPESPILVKAWRYYVCILSI